MGSVVLELQSDCLDKDKAVIDILRKAFLVAKKLDLSEFESWISHELDGYPEGVPVPSYRETICELKANNPYTGWIPYYIPDKEFDYKVRKRHITPPISEIEQLSQCDPEKGNLRIPLSGEEVIRLQKFGNCSFEICAFIPVTVMNKICSTVRNTLLSWAVNLEKQGIFGNDLLFTAEEKSKAMNQTTHIHIENFQGVLGNIEGSTVNQHLTFTITKGDQEELTQTLIKYGVEAADISELIEAIKLDSSSNDDKKTQRQFGSSVSNWIETMIAKAANGAWNVSVTVAANLLTTILSKYYGIAL
ncbi:MAG: hypothetical protein WC748_08435 [Legionellales bacterium]|jgi:hypothetical protein